MSLARGGRPGLLGTIARTAIISGTAQATSNAVNRRQRERWEREAAVEEVPMSAPVAPIASAPVAPAGEPQLYEQISRLAELHRAGVLTSDEFTAAKARLLA